MKPKSCVDWNWRLTSDEVCAVHSKIKTPNAHVVTDTTQANIRSLELKLEAQAQQVSGTRIIKLNRCQLNQVLNERVQEKQTEKGFEPLKKELGEMLAAQFKQLERYSNQPQFYRFSLTHNYNSNLAQGMVQAKERMLSELKDEIGKHTALMATPARLDQGQPIAIMQLGWPTHDESSGMRPRNLPVATVSVKDQLRKKILIAKQRRETGRKGW